MRRSGWVSEIDIFELNKTDGVVNLFTFSILYINERNTIVDALETIESLFASRERLCNWSKLS